MTFPETLFDLEPYGGDSTPRSNANGKRRSTLASKRTAAASIPVEEHREPWVVLRTRAGVAPFFHIPKGLNDYQSTFALCGLVGTKVTNLGVDSMIRCPLCQLALEGVGSDPR